MSLEEVREVAVPRDLRVLEEFLKSDPVGFLPLIVRLEEQNLCAAYAGLRGGSVRTLVEVEKDGTHLTVWPGETKFVDEILQKWGPSRCTLSVGVKHLLAAFEICKPTKALDEIFTMYVDEEHFVFEPTHEAERLGSHELPRPWPRDFKGIAYGVRANGKIVSCGTVSGIVEGVGACGAAIGTDPEYRNKGYATSTLSYAVRDALNIAPVVTYLVESDDTPAMRVLERLGFRFHSSFVYTEAQKKKAHFPQKPYSHLQTWFSRKDSGAVYR